MGELIPIFGMMTGIVMMGIVGLTIVKVVTERIRVRKGPEGPDQALLDEVDRLRAEMDEVQERLDFAERLLAVPSQREPTEPEPGRTPT